MKPTDVCCIYILYKKCKQQIFSIYISPDRAVKGCPVPPFFCLSPTCVSSMPWGLHTSSNAEHGREPPASCMGRGRALGLATGTRARALEGPGSAGRCQRGRGRVMSIVRAQWPPSPGLPVLGWVSSCISPCVLERAEQAITKEPTQERRNRCSLSPRSSPGAPAQGKAAFSCPSIE